MKRAGLAMGLLAVAPFAASGQIRNVSPGEPAPGFSLVDERGRVHALKDYRGKPVVLCYIRGGQALSSKALEAVSRVQARAAKDGVVFLALRREESRETAPAFPVLRDDAESFYGSYGLFVLPVTIVLDKEHRLAEVLSSYTPDLEDDLQNALDKILGKPRRSASATRREVEDSSTVLARKMVDAGQSREALPLLEKALRDGKATLETRLLAAEVLLDLSRAAEAASQLEAALKLDARCARTYLLLGQVRLRQGNRDQAEALLRKSIALEPGRAKARYLLGKLYEDSARPKEALGEYRTALELLPLK